MLYKSTKTGAIYKGDPGIVVSHEPNGTVKIHIGKGGHSMNYMSLAAFETALVEGKSIFFKPAFKQMGINFKKERQ